MQHNLCCYPFFMVAIGRFCRSSLNFQNEPKHKMAISPSTPTHLIFSTVIDVASTISIPKSARVLCRRRYSHFIFCSKIVIACNLQPISYMLFLMFSLLCFELFYPYMGRYHFSQITEFQMPMSPSTQHLRTFFGTIKRDIFHRTKNKARRCCVGEDMGI